MKFEITTHEYEQLLASYASLVSRADMAESQLKTAQTELAEAQKNSVENGKISSKDLLRIFSEVFEAYHTGSKIQAIKKLREYIPCGIKEAKDAIESGMLWCDHCGFYCPHVHVCAKDKHETSALSEPST